MLAGTLSIAILAAACSGDGRPLQEAVETNDLNLKSITISQPKGLLGNLAVNTDTMLQFSLTGVNQANEKIDLSSANRRWSVTPEGSAYIDGNGLLTTIADNQDLLVKVQIGGFGSTFEVKVENATLESIAQITGADSLERCVPKSYSATGNFIGTSGSSSVRGLPNATWTMPTENLASQGTRVDGAIPVTALNVGTLELVVTQDGVSGQKSIVVENTLQQINITPENLVVQEDNTLSLGATGIYLKDGITRDVAITNSVQWSVPANNNVVTVGNLTSNKGLVSTINVGNTQINASCGDLLTQKALIVIERGSTSATDLTFSGSSPRTISLSAGAVQLRVSTGTVYNSDDDISTSDDTDWAVVSGSEFVRFSTIDGKNTIVPINTGVATIRATYNDTSETLEIRVIP